jgi:hypothetical protein
MCSTTTVAAALLLLVVILTPHYSPCNPMPIEVRRFQPMDLFIVQRPRYIRALFNLFSDQTQSEYKTGDNSPVYVHSDSSAAQASSKPKTIAGTLREDAGRIVHGATELITAPIQWMAHMRDNW